LRILHLGDCQANIIHIADAENRDRIREILPGMCDLVLVPIESQEKFIPQAEAFLDLLRPKRAIPMHYWSEAYRDEFLSYLAAQDEVGGKRYLIDRVQGASCVLSSDDPGDGTIKVICLERAPWPDRKE
jgi:L-ascorbate metabolism protein UlaG (beta-lactamase superfamily)